MGERIISLNDKHSIQDLIKNNKNIVDRFAKAKRTRITITDHDTGEVLGEYENKIVITGSMFSGCKTFGIDSGLILPSYNDDMIFDNDQESPTEDRDLKKSIVQLFCIGDDGCGATQRDVKVCNFTDRIQPLKEEDLKAADPKTTCVGKMYPFRYQDLDDDLPVELRADYFGRRTYSTVGSGKIGYFFKKFDTTPELHVMYTDGTQVESDMYENNTDQIAECYVETRLRITRNDFRDFFEEVIGWENARISSLSLCYAWEYIGEDYSYYQDIYPYTKLNFPVEFLVNLDKAIDFNYQVFY